MKMSRAIAITATLTLCLCGIGCTSQPEVKTDFSSTSSSNNVTAKSSQSNTSSTPKKQSASNTTSSKKSSTSSPKETGSYYDSKSGDSLYTYDDGSYEYTDGWGNAIRGKGGKTEEYTTDGGKTWHKYKD